MSIDTELDSSSALPLSFEDLVIGDGGSSSDGESIVEGVDLSMEDLIGESDDVESDDDGQGAEDSDESSDGDSDEGEDLPDDLEDDSDPDQEEESEEDENEDEGEEEESSKEVSFVTKNGKTVNLPEDATVEVKINGELVPVSIKDLKSDFGGQVEIARRFTAIDKMKKQVDHERNEFQQQFDRVNTHINLLKELEPDEFMHQIALMQGKDPEQFYINFVEETRKQLSQLKDMTPNERQLWRENRRYKIHAKLSQVDTKLQQEKQAQQAQQAQAQQAQARVFEALPTHDLTKDEFFAAYEDIKKAIDTEQYKPERELNEGDVIYYAREKKVLTALREVVKSEVPSAKEDYVQKLREALVLKERAEGRLISTSEARKLAKHYIKVHKQETSKASSKNPPLKGGTSERPISGKSKAAEEEAQIQEQLTLLGL